MLLRCMADVYQFRGAYHDTTHYADTEAGSKLRSTEYNSRGGVLVSPGAKHEDSARHSPHDINRESDWMNKESCPPVASAKLL